MQRACFSPPRFLIHNGSLCETNSVGISVFDGVVRHGQGVFETLASYRGVPFIKELHFARLRNGAEVLDLPCPSNDVLSAAMAEVLSANELSSLELARIRITLTNPPYCHDSGGESGAESWFVEATAAGDRPSTVRAITVPYVRNDQGALAGLKTVNYGENHVALKHAGVAGAEEAFFGNTRGELCEVIWSNVFVHIGGTYLTPPLTSGCLPGVTRSLVLELFKSLGVPCGEASLPMSALSGIQSAFLTSTLREIQPVSFLNGRELLTPPFLDELKSAFRAKVEETLTCIRDIDFGD